MVVELGHEARIAPRKSPGGPRNPESIAGKLRDGKTLLVLYEPGGYHSQMTKQGYQFHSRKTPDGWVIWADKR